MSRQRFVLRGGKLIEVDLDAPMPPSVAPYVISDIAPYRSIITREVIGGRAQHRDHLRGHGCIEVGNEMPRATGPAPLPPVRDALIAATEASAERHAEARAASERASQLATES